MDEEPEYLSIDQAAAYLGVSASEVRRLLRRFGLGEFTRASMARQVLIRRADLDALQARGTAPGTSPRRQDARRRRTG